MNIYVASSWRNLSQPRIVHLLRDRGHQVYDFRHPAEDDNGFSWAQIDPDWQAWNSRAFPKALSHPLSEKGFTLDKEALDRADVVVLVLPCGRSAHLELGYAVGKGKLTAILLSPEQNEPELMYKMVDLITDDEAVLFERLAAEKALEAAGHG